MGLSIWEKLPTIEFHTACDFDNLPVLIEDITGQSKLEVYSFRMFSHQTCSFEYCISEVASVEIALTSRHVLLCSKIHRDNVIYHKHRQPLWHLSIFVSVSTISTSLTRPLSLTWRSYQNLQEHQSWYYCWMKHVQNCRVHDEGSGSVVQVHFWFFFFFRRVRK